MKYKIYKTLTPSKAKELNEILKTSNLELKHKMMHLDGTDTYEIREKTISSSMVDISKKRKA